MSRRAMLVLSAALSAFVLVVVGAVAATSMRTASSPPSAVPLAPPAKVAETVPLELVQAREAELRRLVDEANARLRAHAETSAQPVPAPAASAPRGAEQRDDDDRRGRHERRLARREHEEDDDG